MAKQPTSPRCETRSLDDLHSFPLQPSFFDEASEEELSQLAVDIKRNGLREKPEILPKNQAGYRPNTIIKGHQRLRALRLNDETKCEVIVRYDLAQADAAEIEREFLEDNQHRRQLDILAKARVALRLVEIEKGRDRGELWGREQTDARDRVGKTIGMSGRNLQRYFRVLQTPLEVQNAFRAKKLKLVVAEKVADLSRDDQEQITEEIREGGDPLTVVQRFLPENDVRHQKAWDALLSFVRCLDRGLHDLEGRVDKFRGGYVLQYLPTLTAARDVIKQIIRQNKNVKPPRGVQDLLM